MMNGSHLRGVPVEFNRLFRVKVGGHESPVSFKDTHRARPVVTRAWTRRHSGE